eukprot:scaffold316747_cov13-Tisochrysis_lutea.AAC.1
MPSLSSFRRRSWDHVLSRPAISRVSRRCRFRGVWDGAGGRGTVLQAEQRANLHGCVHRQAKENMDF